MGARRRRRLKFLNAHPRCCFCGGDEPTAEEDHVPGRGMFDGRQWPEGYSFPACARCNRLTAQDEGVVGFLSRVRPHEGPPTDQQAIELKRAMAALHDGYPDAFRSLRVAPNEVRKFLRERNIELPPGHLLSDVPIVSIIDPLFQHAIRRFAIKLLCALHYKHVGAIVPKTAAVAGRWFSNLQIADGVLSEELLRVVGQGAIVKRANTDLGEQFSYRYAIAIEKTVSVFLCAFRRSFAITGFISLDPNLSTTFDEDLERGTFMGSPFLHDAECLNGGAR